MKCNTSKCKKKGCKETLPPVQGIEQLKERTVLGLMLQDNCKIFRTCQDKIMESK